MFTAKAQLRDTNTPRYKNVPPHMYAEQRVAKMPRNMSQIVK